MPASEVVVVTDATSGLGRAVVRRFARPGVSLGLVSQRGDRLESTRREVEAAGARALTMACDIADPAALDAVVQAVEEAYGPIDIWIGSSTRTRFGALLWDRRALYGCIAAATGGGAAWRVAARWASRRR
jgi:short-subunit dehydrogenase